MTKELQAYLEQAIGTSVQRHGYELSTASRKYMATTLERFVLSENLFTEYDLQGEQFYGLKPITLQYYATLEMQGEQKKQDVKQVAEHCLFLVGYCYDSIRKAGKGNVRYHCDVGMSAYDLLAATSNPPQPLYEEVAHHFWELGVVVGDLHIPELRARKKQFKRVMDRWLETRDKRYELLIQGVLETEGMVISSFVGDKMWQ